MGLFIAILTILSSAGFLYYMGRSGYSWRMDEDDEH
jgi:hypothetical protein